MVDDTDEKEQNFKNICSVVKWFNQDKGFGFVEPANGIGDAFIHISTVKKAGYTSLVKGAKVDCDVVKGPKGIQVLSVVDIKGNEETKKYGSGVDGEVKFYNVEKGFGFIVSEEGGEPSEIYISKNALIRSDINNLETGQKVKVVAGVGSKGLVAETIELVDEDLEV